jgi:putative transposase
MPEYRRIKQPGGTFFFTVVTFDRKPILTTPESRPIFRKAWKDVQVKHPFQTLAICLLPDHLHTIWQLPEGDTNYALRWNEIKRHFSHEYLQVVGEGDTSRNESRKKRREVAIWQRRYWTHILFDQDDLNNHIDYIHFNPLKHGLVKQVMDWPWSSFHRYMRMGVYSQDWCRSAEEFPVDASMGE